MKKSMAAVFLLLPVFLSAQTVRWQTFQQSISINDADTTFFAFRPSGFLSNSVSPDSLVINPPDVVEADENPMVTFRKVSGTNADSVISYAKPIDFAGRIMQGDSIFVLGATFAAPATPNTFGDGRLYGKTLSFNMKRYNGVIVISKNFDLTGGTRRYEWGFGTR